MGIVRLLPPLLLLLFVPSGFREYLNRRPEDDRRRNAAAGADEVVLHPIVLVPGVSCSKLEVRLTDAYRPSAPRCGAMKGKGWFGLWASNCSDLLSHHYLPCFMEQLSLVYDPAAGDYHNLPGVETRVPNFGSSRGFQKNPEHPDWCLEVLRHELERIGYVDGNTLFGAPYDFRHAPPVPGEKSEVFTRYFRQLTLLIEDASKKNHGRKVILFGHSYGGMLALEFLRNTPMAWRDKYIKHLVLVAPLPSGGFLQPVRYFASGSDFLCLGPYVPRLALALRPLWRSFESSIINFPSPAVFGRAAPLVVTRRRNYTAGDMEEFLADAGAGAAVEPFRRRAVPRMEMDYDFKAPMVPTTCINGVGNETPERLVYWDDDGDFDAAPEVVNGDGDGDINLVSMLAFDEAMRRHPGQSKMFKTVKIHGVDHGMIVTKDWALKRVMQEILEANNRI